MNKNEFKRIRNIKDVSQNLTLEKRIRLQYPAAKSLNIHTSNTFSLTKEKKSPIKFKSCITSALNLSTPHQQTSTKCKLHTALKKYRESWMKTERKQIEMENQQRFRWCQNQETDYFTTAYTKRKK